MTVSLAQLLQTMVKNGGSDLHVASNSPPMIRIRGDVIRLNLPPLSPAEVISLTEQMIDEFQKVEFQKHQSIDFAYKVQGIGVFRVNLFMQRHGASFVMRALTENPPTIDDLKLPEICRTACSYANGLVLVTGPTGSGKSTTLAAMINHINRSEKGHILTLEDPIEFQHESQLCMVNQRALGQHFTDFASAMKAALREDPDVILVGEMRDLETISLALKAAETGHLVFSTLHTNSAAKTVDRIINSFPAEEQSQIRTLLSETLKVVLAQKLVPSIDKKRRICFFDILVNTPASANLIREGKTFQIPTVMQTGKRDGMQICDQMMLEAVKRGEISGEVAWEMANEKNVFSQWAPGGAATASSGTPPGGTSTPQPQAPKKAA